MDMKEYIEEQLEMCRNVNAETASVSFETDEWRIKIEVKRKKGGE